MKRYIRIAVCAVSTVMVLWFALPLLFSGILNAGNAAGMAAFGLTDAAAIFYDRLSAWVNAKGKRSPRRVLMTLLTVCFALAALTAAVCGAMMLTAIGNKPEKGEPVTAVVLGCQVNPNGPSRMLGQRIRAAYDFLKENPEAKAVLSGGKGDNEPKSEALCMYETLTSMGIEKDRLFMEDSSVSTIENLDFSRRVIKENGLPEKIAVVSHGFHLRRAGMYAKRLGMEYRCVAARTDWWLLPTYTVREMGGIILELVGIKR